MKKISSFTLLLLALLLTMACGDDKKKVSLDISPGNPVIMSGDAVYLTVAAENTDIILPDWVRGTYQQVGRYGVKFTASEPAPEGGTNPVLLEPGEYNFVVTAKSDKDKTAVSTIVVVPRVAVVPATPTVVQYDTEHFTANVEPPLPAGTALNWTVDKPEVAEITAADGVFTGKTMGDVTVTVSFTDPATKKVVTASTKVTVVKGSAVFSWVRRFDITSGTTGSIALRPYVAGDTLKVDVSEMNNASFVTTYKQVTLNADDGKTMAVTGGDKRMENPAYVAGPKLSGFDSLNSGTAATDGANYSVGMMYRTPPGGFMPDSKLESWNAAGDVLKSVNLTTFGQTGSSARAFYQDGSFLLGYTSTAAGGTATLATVDPDNLELGTSLLDAHPGWFADIIYDGANDYVLIATVYALPTYTPTPYVYEKASGTALTPQQITELTGFDSFTVSYVIRNTDGSYTIVGTGTSAGVTSGFVARTRDNDFAPVVQ